MDLKKIISMMLATAMMITFMTPVMASTSDSTTSASTGASTSIAVSADKGLENAIKAVKEKIVIPEDYDKFTYNIYNQNGLTAWNLGWSNEEAQKNINVTIDENNLISNYSSYHYTAYEKKIPKYSKEQGRVIAEKFINNLDSKLLPQYKLVENNDYNVDREYYFNYTRQVNGISYNMNNISVNVNNYTGEVTNYNCGFSKNTDFEDATKIISLEQAKKAFIEKLGLKMVYNTRTENEKNVTYLAYVPKDSNKYIDAITGEVETSSGNYGVTYDYSLMDQKAKVMEAAGVGANVVLTPDEIEAVKGMSDLISKEDADKKVRAISLFKLDSEFKISSANLSKDWRNKDSFIWSLNYTKIINKDTNQTKEVQVSLDAKSGDIQNFWTYYPSVEGAKPLKTKAEAKTISDDVLKTLIPGIYAKVKFDDTYYTYDDKSQNQFSFRYVRMENGLECPNDYVTISYDNLSGNVTNMNSNWTNDLKFDDPTKDTISIEKAYQVLFEKIGYDIQYVNDYSSNVTDKIVMPVPVDSSKAVLGYFINGNKPNIISATTGDILNYSGNVYKENGVTDYTDIKGLKAENQIKILTGLSIKYNESELKPNEELLQKDYFLLLSKLNDLYYVDQNTDDEKNVERMYNGLISQGIITKADKAPLSTLTRETAAKYFVKFLRIGQIAEIKGIYKSDFKDADKINPDLLGYVCLTSGLKAMNGSNGYFMPKSEITRLDGLLSIYSYLSNK